MADFARWVRAEYAQLEPQALLNEPATRLLDVSAAAARALLALQVVTIGDLATSRTFANARAIIEAGQRDDSLHARLGRFSGDMLDKAGESVPIADVPGLPLQTLSGIGPQTAARLVGALPLAHNTIADLAGWPAYTAACAILSAFTAAPAPDAPGAPDDPPAAPPEAELVTYTLAVLDPGAPPAGRALDTGGLDLADAPAPDDLFQHPAHGALVSIQQTWRPGPQTKGDLLHITTLVPGERVRLVVRDQRPAADSAQAGEPAEQGAAQPPALREVAAAVAAQLAGGYVARPGQWLAELAQLVAAHTRDAAGQARARRAPLVSECAPGDGQGASRFVANHSPTYPLTLIYSEALQVYQVETRPLSAAPCLFVPLKPVAAWTPDLIGRYRPLLARYALSEAFRRALAAEGEAAAETIYAHLGRNRRYYSQVIWLHMEPLARERLLAGYSYNGRPLLQQVDPAPAAAVEGALVFRLLAPDNPAAWQGQLAAAGLQSPAAVGSNAIALPGGVSAEALLGDPALGDARVAAVLPVELDAPLAEVEALGRVVVEVG